MDKNWTMKRQHYVGAGVVREEILNFYIHTEPQQNKMPQ